VELRPITDFLVRSWEQLVGRTSGPIKLRLILQPSAAFLAVRAGLKDAREGRQPYLWACFTDSCHRRENYEYPRGGLDCVKRLSEMPRLVSDHR